MVVVLLLQDLAWEAVETHEVSDCWLSIDLSIEDNCGDDTVLWKQVVANFILVEFEEELEVSALTEIGVELVYLGDILALHQARLADQVHFHQTVQFHSLNESCHRLRGGK